MHIGILVNQLQYSDGVSNHVFNLLTGFRKYYSEINFTVFTGSFSAHELFNEFSERIVVVDGFSHLQRSPLNYARSVIKVKNEVTRRSIDLLHSHTHYHANLAAEVKRFTSVKTVQTNHGIIPKAGILPLLRADHYIAVNAHIIEFLKHEKKISHEKLSLIRSGNLLSELDISKLNKEPGLFIAAGRMIREKGFDMYIRAAASLPDDVKNGCRFLLAGSGEDLNDFLKLNDELRAGVEYIGNLRNMRETLERSCVLVNPSRSRSEGFPAVIIEAALLGNFILTSEFSGLTYDFDPRTDGFTFEVDNQEALNKILLKAITDRIETEKRRKCFTEKAVKIFSLKEMTEKIFTVYNSLMCLK